MFLYISRFQRRASQTGYAPLLHRQLALSPCGTDRLSGLPRENVRSFLSPLLGASFLLRGLLAPHFLGLHSKRPFSLQKTHLFSGFFFFFECFYYSIKFAVHYTFYVVPIFIYSVVSNAVLRKIVSSYLLTSLCRSNLLSSSFRQF